MASPRNFRKAFFWTLRCLEHRVDTSRRLLALAKKRLRHVLGFVGVHPEVPARAVDEQLQRIEAKIRVAEPHVGADRTQHLRAEPLPGGTAEPHVRGMSWVARSSHSSRHSSRVSAPGARIRLP